MKHAKPQRRSTAETGLIIALFCVVFLAGLMILLWPKLVGIHLKHQAHVAVSEFFDMSAAATSNNENNNDISFEYVEGPTVSPTPFPYTELYEAMQQYNESIYANGQSGLTDAWSYQQASFDLTAYGVEDGAMGVISIPKMDVELPIYLGATYDNMAAGAVHLSQTSLPIGGENTNCVIAAHRGWYGAPFFRYIELLEVGDEVYITNLWETLTYRVSEIKVIKPNDINEILIQPGRDMLTLLTCHPYASGGRYRYVVYCDRVTSVG